MLLISIYIKCYSSGRVTIFIHQLLTLIIKHTVLSHYTMERRLDMRHMSCDQIAPIIAFHTALQSGSAVS